ncbi:MAG: carbamoyltransferase HypF, partial [Thioalkalivibrio sp.]
HFDAAAGLLGIKPVQRFEGQAAMLLEGLAEQHGPADPLRNGWAIDAGHTLNLRPLLAWLADRARHSKAASHGVRELAPAFSGLDLRTTPDSGGLPPSSPCRGHAPEPPHQPHAAAVFHATLAAALCDWIRPVAEAAGIRHLVFSGGCVLNQVLTTELEQRLTGSGYRVHLPRLAPANDGGLSLGQAWIAMNVEDPARH